jgi:hypothetical protein
MILYFNIILKAGKLSFYLIRQSSIFLLKA